MIKVGDWVTQYYKGYWMVIGIVHTPEENWIIMKKGFTPKMVFKLDSSYCDEGWCRPISPAQKKIIDLFFEEHPAEYQKFTDYEYVDRPAIASIWIEMNSEDERKLQLMISKLPPLFTSDLFLLELKKCNLQRIITKPPAKHLLTFEHTVWEMDDDNKPLFKNQRIKDFNSG